MSEHSTDELLVRAAIADLRAQQLYREARSTTDLARLDAIGAEIDVVVSGLMDIRIEQVVATLVEPPPPVARRGAGAGRAITLLGLGAVLVWARVFTGKWLLTVAGLTLCAVVLILQDRRLA